MQPKDDIKKILALHVHFIYIWELDTLEETIPALLTMGFRSKVAHSTMSYFFWLHKLFRQQWNFRKGIWYTADALQLFIVSYKREFVKSHPKRHMGYYGRTLMLLLHHSLWQDTLIRMKVYGINVVLGNFLQTILKILSYCAMYFV